MRLSLFSFQKLKKSIFVIGLIAFGSASPAYAKIHHVSHKHHPAGVSRTASYADIVIDAETGRILHATDPDGLRHPASLTKMMTLYLTFQALEDGRLHLDDDLSVSANAAEQSPSKLGLRRGQHIEVEDAILGVVTESANDAAVVLAENIGGNVSHFSQMMTHEAHALGMSHTNFHNPSGLPDQLQVTTARDMAVLGHALIYHYSQYYSYFSRDEFTYAGITHHNHNHLMERYDGMDGIKTGYIRASGFNLVASAVRGNTRLIGVVFGGHSTLARDNQMALLLDQAFDKARQEKGDMRLANRAGVNLAEGDNSGGDDESQYVALPSKTPIMAQVPPSSIVPSWGIQIGAYNDPSVGRQALGKLMQTLPQYLSHATPALQQIVAGGITMYRARLTGIDEKSARAACTWFMQHGQSCLTVAPAMTLAQ